MQTEHNADPLPSENLGQRDQLAASEHHEITPPAALVGGERFALPAVQEIALQRLTAGSSIVEAARAARVDRRTVQRWIRSDPQFGAAYNAWKHEMLASGRARLLAMSDMALNTLQSAMLQGNARVAVQVAEATGVMNAIKPGATDPGRLYRRKRLRDAKWRKELADFESSEARSRRGKDYRHPVRCEHMIDTYIKCRREAIQAESPESRARRLEQQPKYRRHYDPITLRLLASMEADEAAAPPVAPNTGQPPPLDRAKRKKTSREPSGNPERLTWRERQVLEQLRRKMLGEAVQIEEVTLAPWEVEAINAARQKLLDDGLIPEADGHVVPGPRDPCGSGKPIGDRKQLESRAVPPRALPAPPPAPFLTGED